MIVKPVAVARSLDKSCPTATQNLSPLQPPAYQYTDIHRTEQSRRARHHSMHLFLGSPRGDSRDDMNRRQNPLIINNSRADTRMQHKTGLLSVFACVPPQFHLIQGLSSFTSGAPFRVFFLTSVALHHPNCFDNGLSPRKYKRHLSSQLYFPISH